MLAMRPQDIALRLGALDAMGISLALTDHGLSYRGPENAVSPSVLSFLGSNRNFVCQRLSEETINPKVFRTTLVQKQYMSKGLGALAVPLNNCMLTRVALRADEVAFQRAVQRVLDHNPMFGAAFFDCFEDKFFYFPDPVGAIVEWLDMSALTPERRAAELDALHERVASSILDSSTGKVLRLVCVRTDQLESEIILCAHYVVSDGSTLMSFVHQLVQVLRTPDAKLRTVDSERHLSRLAAQDEALYSGIDRDALKELIGALPSQQSRLSISDNRKDARPTLGSARYLIDGEEFSAIKRYASSMSMTPFVVLMASYCNALFRTWPQWNGLLSIATSMRETDDDVECPGPRVNSVVLNVPRKDWSLGELAEFANHKMDALRRLGSLPIEQFVADLRVGEREPVIANWHNVMFNYLRFPFRASQETESSMKDFDMIPTHGTTLFKMYLWDAAFGLNARVVYRADIVDAADAAAVFSLFRAGLKRFSTSDDQNSPTATLAYF